MLEKAIIVNQSKLIGFQNNGKPIYEKQKRKIVVLGTDQDDLKENIFKTQNYYEHNSVFVYRKKVMDSI